MKGDGLYEREGGAGRGTGGYIENRRGIGGGEGGCEEACAV